MTAEKKARFLRGVPLFESLADDHVATLAELLTTRSFPRSHVIFFEGDMADALYIVLTGTVKIYRVAEDGREKTLAILSDGEFFGEMALLDGEPRSAIAETLAPTTVYVLRRSEFHQLLADIPSMALEIIRVLSMRLRDTNAQLMDVVFRDVRGRIARTLLELAERRGVPSGEGRLIPLKLTHQEIANLVGTARETVSRVLAELQDARVVRLEGRYIVVLEPGDLKTYAAGY